MPTIKKTKKGFTVQHTTKEVWGVDDPSEAKRNHAAIRAGKSLLKAIHADELHNQAVSSVAKALK